jgi:hypothetical protein
MILRPFKVTIPSGAAVAPFVDLGAARLVGINIPATWTAADLTFQSALNPEDLGAFTYQNTYDETGTEVVVKAAAARNIRFTNPALFLGIRFLIVRSGTSAAPVNQAADRDLYLMTVP